MQPGNITTTATSAGGAVVTSATPSGTAFTGEPFGLTCTPPSGSLFPLGTTAVTCTGTDVYSQVATTSFTVTVTVPAVLVLTAPDVVVPATTPVGTFMTYGTPAATDVTGAPVTLTCDRPSGALFPVGVTPVTCSGTSAIGQLVIVTFNVVVTVGAPQAEARSGQATNPCTATAATAGQRPAEGVTFEALPFLQGGGCGAAVTPTPAASAGTSGVSVSALPTR